MSVNRPSRRMFSPVRVRSRIKLLAAGRDGIFHVGESSSIESRSGRSATTLGKDPSKATMNSRMMPDTIPGIMVNGLSQLRSSPAAKVRRLNHDKGGSKAVLVSGSHQAGWYAGEFTNWAHSPLGMPPEDQASLLKQPIRQDQREERFQRSNRCRWTLPLPFNSTTASKAPPLNRQISNGLNSVHTPQCCVKQYRYTSAIPHGTLRFDSSRWAFSSSRQRRSADGHLEAPYGRWPEHGCGWAARGIQLCRTGVLARCRGDQRIGLAPWTGAGP